MSSQTRMEGEDSGEPQVEIHRFNGGSSHLMRLDPFDEAEMGAGTTSGGAIMRDDF